MKNAVLKEKSNLKVREKENAVKVRIILKKKSNRTDG